MRRRSIFLTLTLALGLAGTAAAQAPNRSGTGAVASTGARPDRGTTRRRA